MIDKEKSKIALHIAYDGSAYHGWQRQSAQPSVQAAIEKALSQVADEPIQLMVSGRTDKGVHASFQVAHFDCQSIRPLSAWVKGGNVHLPQDISIINAYHVDDDFHARYQAKWRTYRYFVWQDPVMMPWARMGWTHYPYQLNHDAMQEAAQHCLGENDFSSFRAAYCQSLSTHRNIKDIQITANQYGCTMTVTGNAFLHHMVRNIMGSLFWVGQGKRSAQWMQELLLCHDRTQAGPTAPANGLWLIGIDFGKLYSDVSGLKCPYEWRSEVK